MTNPVGKEREALEEAERALRGARDGLDFGLGCARDLEGDNSPVPVGERSRRQDHFLKEARRSHAIVEAALAGREEPQEPSDAEVEAAARAHLDSWRPNAHPDFDWGRQDTFLRHRRLTAAAAALRAARNLEIADE